MTDCYVRTQWRLLLLPNLMVAVSVPALMTLGLLGLVPTPTVGFYCNDPKLSHKFSGNSISLGLMYLIATLLPAIVIGAVEWIFHSKKTAMFWRYFVCYAIGLYYLHFICFGLKIFLREPRPHFFDTCKPKEMYNCTDNTYFESYTCTDTKFPRFRHLDSDKSFLSVHAAISMFTATFLTIYLQKRIPDRMALILVKPWLQFLLILWGFACGITRITDHRHHWWDVAVGYAFGIQVGLYTVYVLCKSFKSHDLSRSHLSRNITSDSTVVFDKQCEKKCCDQSIKTLLSTNIEVTEDPSKVATLRTA